MIHWELLCTNPLTGKKVWAVRSIPSGEYGTRFDWGFIARKEHRFSRCCEVMMAMGMDQAKRRAMQQTIAEHGFTSATAVENGRRVYWDRLGVRYD